MISFFLIPDSFFFLIPDFTEKLVFVKHSFAMYLPARVINVEDNLWDITQNRLLSSTDL